MELRPSAPQKRIGRMSQQQIRKVEEKIQDALREILLIEPQTSTQGDARQDMIDVLVEAQRTELMVLKRAFE